jgi:hypothetical protein
MTGDATSALVRATRQRKRTLQATPGRSDHRPADLAATPLLPLRSRRRSGALATFLRYSSDRTVSNPSAVTIPRATASHNPSPISAGSLRVSVVSSDWKSAPWPRSASRTSPVRPGPGSGGVRPARAG